MAEALLKTKGLIKRFGGLVATDNLSIEVRANPQVVAAYLGDEME